MPQQRHLLPAWCLREICAPPSISWNHQQWRTLFGSNKRSRSCEEIIRPRTEFSLQEKWPGTTEANPSGFLQLFLHKPDQYLILSKPLKVSGEGMWINSYKLLPCTQSRFLEIRQMHLHTHQFTYLHKCRTPLLHQKQAFQLWTRLWHLLLHQHQNPALHWSAKRLMFLQIADTPPGSAGLLHIWIMRQDSGWPTSTGQNNPHGYSQGTS